MPVHKGPGCVGEEMSRFRRGELHSGKSGKIVTNRKQAQAIALSACGKSKYSETLQSMGFSAETSEKIVTLFAELNWDKQFENGKGPGESEPDSLDTGDTKSRNNYTGQVGKGKGNSGRTKTQAQSISGPALPKGPGDPMAGSSKDVHGMRQLG